MSKKTWIIFVAVVVAMFGALIYFSGGDQVDVSEVNESRILSGSEASGGIGDHVFGNPDAKVTLLEYGDFQCPTCKSVHEPLKTVTEKYADQVAFVYRNFPITAIHPNALAAAAAAEAAGLQGKYWEMHNRLYEDQASWSNLPVNERTDFFVGYARELGLNEAEFREDIASEAVSQKIRFDQALGAKVGVDGTPAVYLNDTKLELDDLTSAEALEAAIRAELEKQGVALPEENK